MAGVIVVGAGIAGLSAAYELHRRGVSFTLLEATSRAGGVVLSEEIDGYVIDGGPDSLLVQKPDGVRLCEELGLGPRLVPTLPPRIAYIQRRGRLHPLPAASVLGIPTRVAPFVGTSLFSWAAKIRMGAELFVPAKRDDTDESIGAFMTRRFGEEATEYLAEPLLAGIHAGDVDRLSLRSLFPRFVEAERSHGSLLRAFRAQPRAPQTDGAFRSLPGGLSELIRALVAALPPRAIALGTPVERILAPASRAEPAASIPLPRFFVETTRGERLPASAVIVATPAHAAARILESADAALARMCGEVRYASTATVVLAFPRSSVAHPLDGSGFVVPRREGTGILAASWLSSKWPHRAPPGHVLLRAFVGGARDPESFGRSDAEMVTRALGALSPLLGISGAPLMTRVYRWERASAQHEVGHLARMAAIDRMLTAHPGLFVTGSGFRGVGIPDCIADGRATAGRAAEIIAAPQAAAVSSKP